MKRPVVVGVAGGVGTSTVAAAIGGDDLGTYRADDDADVVVCRSTASSLELAHAVVNDLQFRAAVVLVVVADSPGKTPAVVRSLIRMVEPHLQAAVAVPWVPTWRQERRPVDQAAQALTAGVRWLHPFRRAMEEVLEAAGRAEHRVGTTSTARPQTSTSSSPRDSYGSGREGPQEPPPRDVESRAAPPTDEPVALPGRGGPTSHELPGPAPRRAVSSPHPGVSVPTAGVGSSSLTPRLDHHSRMRMLLADDRRLPDAAAPPANQQEGQPEPLERRPLSKSNGSGSSRAQVEPFPSASLADPEETQIVPPRTRERRTSW